jgi:hypothetical protein
LFTEAAPLLQEHSPEEGPEPLMAWWIFDRMLDETDLREMAPDDHHHALETSEAEAKTTEPFSPSTTKDARPDTLAEKPEEECVVCREHKRCLAFQPCGHVPACHRCAAQIDQCPMCRQPVKSTLRIFW